MSKDFVATLNRSNPDRYQEWLEFFGTDQVCILSPFPARANLPGHPNSLIYLIDLDQLKPEILDRLIKHLMQKFYVDQVEAEREIRTKGIPILDEDCSITIYNPQRWLE